MPDYETIIGLEVHAQLNTKSKMYCTCSTSFGNAPNSNICPICTGQPGTLPTINKTAVKMAIKAGLALGCTIQNKSVFSRKNYFYPDLPKGYQISQFDLPLCLGGHLNIVIDDQEKYIGITRIHMEEDAGKSIHDQGSSNASLVDFNRCSMPLIEIVSEPDMRTSKEAGEYLRVLRNVLVYLDVCEGNLQEGNFRCDANVSIRPKGQKKFGTRTEMKNLNSYRAVEHAIDYEVKRQAQLLDSDNIVIQETRLWNDAQGKTYSLRSKEEAHDYRYFPEPDLLPLIVTDDYINAIKQDLPELAPERAKRFIRDYDIRNYDAKILTDDKHLANYFEDVVGAGANATKASNWILSELLRELNDSNMTICDCKVTATDLAALILLIDDNTISGKIAKDVFIDMFASGNSPKKIISDKGLVQLNDTTELEKIIDDILVSCSKQIEQYHSGKTAVFGFFVGQVMKATKGKANPGIVNDLLKKKLTQWGC